MSDERRKVYVDVIQKNTKNGIVIPLQIIWEDGVMYEVDRVIHSCPAASTRVGGCGIRYTVSICGSQTYLFYEDSRWFVEGKKINPI